MKGTLTQYIPNRLMNWLEGYAWRSANQCPGCGHAWHDSTCNDCHYEDPCGH